MNIDREYYDYISKLSEKYELSEIFSELNGKQELVIRELTDCLPIDYVSKEYNILDIDKYVDNIMSELKERWGDIEI